MFLVLIQWSSSFKALSSLRSRKWNIVKENIHCRLDKAVYLRSMHFAKRKPYSDAFLDTLWWYVVVSESVQNYLQFCVNFTDVDELPVMSEACVCCWNCQLWAGVWRGLVKLRSWGHISSSLIINSSLSQKPAK